MTRAECIEGQEGVLRLRFWTEQLGSKAWWQGLGVFVVAATALGCAGTPRRAAHVRPPAATPRPIPKVSFRNLPLESPSHANLVAATRPGVDLLIEQVQRDFRQGETDYQADRLPQARQHFDNAINRLMASGLNFSVDPRLEPLMDRLIRTMHDFQMKTEQVGANSSADQAQSPDESTEPRSPLEEIAASANLPANPEVDQKAAAELLHIPHDLPLTINKPVLNFLSFFQTPRGRRIIEHSLARSGMYIGMVRQVFKEEGLPQDLMYLPLPESGYQPRAVSRKGARGLWQFMPATGRLYGLKINRWEDQRMDPIDSTRAAAEHLRDLYGIFHDWYLVLAAYDSGPLTVARAIERTGYADFWQLYRLNALPAETKNYVPIMLAMTLVAKDPTLYGVHIADPEKPLKITSFKPGRSIDLRLVADAIGVKVKMLRNLNPALFGVVTPKDPSYVLHLPAGTVPRLRATLASIPPSHWVGWRLHRVTPDDTLAALAHHYHTNVAKLVAANDLSSGDSLPPGKVLLVPAPVLPTMRYYRVRSGDTLGGIARRYRVSVRDLRLWNHLRSNLIRIHQVLRIYTREGVPRYRRASYHRRAARHGESHGGRTHIVHWGESFWSIARRYHVTVKALRRANPEIARRGLKAGDRVVIP
jgi:membrane-bound lytic murein transglycosylase D